MAGLEFNKMAAGVLVAGLVAMVSGKVADVLYHPVTQIDKRGFSVEIAADPSVVGDAAAADDAPVEIATLLPAADATAGKAVTNKCAACHDFTKDGPNKVGPNLWGVLGRDRGAHPGFTYSDAMKTKGGKWDYQSLSEFLTKPSAYVAGTKMGFAGLKKPEDRANVIAYLRSLSDAPLPLPDVKK